MEANSTIKTAVPRRFQSPGWRKFGALLMERGMAVFWSIISVGGMIAAGRLLMKPKQDQTALGLEAFFLALSAMVASFFFTRLSDELRDNRRLREKGVEIARGIMVLRRSLEQLQEWVDHKRMAGKGYQPTDSLLDHIQ